MVLVTFVLQVFSLLSATAAPVSFSISNEGNQGWFSSVDQAFSETAGLGDVELSLLPSLSAYSTSVPAVLSNRVRVRGEGQSLQLGGTLQVGESGLLIISNVSLSASQAFAAAFAFNVRGSFRLENSSMRGLQVPLIWLGGRASLTNVSIVGNTQSIIELGGNAVADLDSVSVSQLTSFVVCLDLSFVGVPFTVTVTNSSFTECQAPIMSVFGRGGTIRIVSSTYSRNSGKAAEGGAGVRHIVTFDNCVFRDNLNTIAAYYTVSEGYIHFSNCSFTNNFDIALYVWTFAGTTVLEDCTMIGGAGLLFVWTSLASAASLMVLSNVYIADINSVPENGQRSTIVAIYSSTAHISNLTISNVTLGGANSLLIFTAVFLFQLATVRMSNIAVRDCKVDLCMIQSFFSSTYVSNFTVDNFTFGAAFYFIGGGSCYLENAAIRQVTIVPVNYPDLLSILKATYFGIFASSVEVRNASLSNSMQPMGPCFSMAFANYSFSNISISHMFVEAILVSSLSNGDFSDVQIDRVTIDMHAFLGSFSVSAISNLLFTNSQMINHTGVILFGKSLATINNFVLRNCSMEAFLYCHGCTVGVKSLVIEQCSVNWSILTMVSSEGSIEGLEIRESTMRSLSLTDSNVTIGHSAFTSLHSQDMLLDLARSRLSCLHLSCVHITTVNQLARIIQGSTVTIQASQFIQLLVVEESGWQLSLSVLHVSSSRFSYFNYGLFQAVECNITLLNSTFVEGRNPIQSLKSTAAFGGVLGCVNCPLVSITETNFFNNSARVGGAVAATRSVRYTGELWVAVKSCAFEGCTALQAGALFFQNTSFTVDTSVFLANTASQAGGGLFAAIKPWHSGLIRNCRFVKNSAFEGGAVKWSNAPVLLANVTFQENSAAYGPDTASYGVALSSALTHLAGNESSGYPLSVLFELLDHYGHRVQLSPFKNLVLLTTTTVAYRGNNATLLSLGLFNFSSLTVYAAPASTHTLLAVLSDTQEDFPLRLVGSISIHFRPCQSGEIQRSDRCDYCYPGYYSFAPSDANCSFCPGGNALEVSAGYWRAWNSSEVVVCPFPAKCLGNSTCFPGFTGSACSQCAPNATHIRAVECVACRVGLVVVQLAASVFVPLLLRWVVARLAVYRPHPNKLFALNVLVSHLQYLSALCFLRVSYSEVMNWSLHAVNWLSILDLPLACLGVSQPEYAKALIGSLLLPSFLLLNWLADVLRPTLVSSSRVLASSMLLYTPYIALLTTVPLLACQEIDSQQVLLVDVSVVCWDHSHNQSVRLLVLPSLLLNVGAPLAVLGSFRLFRPVLYSRHFPMWTIGYKVKLYGVFLCAMQWVFACTLILTTALVPLLQVTYAFIPLIFLCTVNVSLRSWIYTSDRHFLLAEASLLTIALSLGFLSYYVFYLPGQGGAEYFATAMVLLLNAVFFGLCGGSMTLNWLEAKRSDTKDSFHQVPPNSPVESADWQSA